MNIKKIEKWERFELELDGPVSGNPFMDVEFKTHFKYKNRIITADGFYDGSGKYKVRFMPDTEGAWDYYTLSNCRELDGISGQFECVKPETGNHGLVRVNQKFHFIYDDGTPYIPVGTTCYVWNHQGAELEKQTLESLKHSPFNKIRMCVFPKRYVFNENEPEYYPFEGTREEGWDFSRFNPLFFQHLESLIGELLGLNIEADLILFHPYDKGHWGFDRMDFATDERYLQYVVARLAAYRNIWWSFANEFDFMVEKNTRDWDNYFRIVQARDPYGHLRSIHNGREIYDHNKPWVTHCSIQHNDVHRTGEWRQLYNKPVVIDECKYEGNIFRRWGSISAQELVHRFWEGFVMGGYVGHGETYVHPGDILWWSKGGKLYGQSPARIAFLRQILEAGPELPLEPVKIGKNIFAAAGKGDAYFLVYNGISQPIYQFLDLPEHNQYTIEIIDTWEMTITPLDGVFSGHCRVDLPGKPYIAFRAIKI